LRNEMVSPFSAPIERTESVWAGRGPSTGFNGFQHASKNSQRIVSNPSHGKQSVAAQRKPDDCPYQVGDRVTVSLSAGRIAQATIKAIIYFEAGTQLQVDFGHETALVSLEQVRRD